MNEEFLRLLAVLFNLAAMGFYVVVIREQLRQYYMDGLRNFKRILIALSGALISIAFLSSVVHFCRLTMICNGGVAVPVSAALLSLANLLAAILLFLLYKSRIK